MTHDWLSLGAPSSIDLQSIQWVFWHLHVTILLRFLRRSHRHAHILPPNGKRACAFVFDRSNPKDPTYQWNNGNLWRRACFQPCRDDSLGGMWTCASEVSLTSTACMRFQSTWCHSSKITGWCQMGWAVRMQDSGCSTFISEPLLCMPFEYIPSAALWLWKQWSQQTAHSGTLAILTGLKVRVYDRLMWKCGANSNYRLHNSNLIFLGFALEAYII